jgi:hypothetical protein
VFRHGALAALLYDVALGALPLPHPVHRRPDAGRPAGAAAAAAARREAAHAARREAAPAAGSILLCSREQLRMRGSRPLGGSS